MCDRHADEADCTFGCKVRSIGFDGGHTTRARTDELNNTVTEHRDGRQDVLIRAPKVAVTATAKELR